MTDALRSLGAVGDVLRSAGLLVEAPGPGDVAVMGVAQDSRTVKPGDLFLAWRGTVHDGHDHVAEARDRGAVACVVERPVDVDLPQLVVADGRRAAALAAAGILGFPSEELRTVGITGTNGKTTTTLLLRDLLASRMRTAAIGTLGLVDDDGVRPGSEALTTPGPVQLAGWLRNLADEGFEAVVLEASSHALEQRRLDGMTFDVAVFTNLSQDHLDYHGDLDSYRAAKVRLVDLVAPAGVVALNGDERAWDGVDVGSRRRVTFAVGSDAEVGAESVELGPGGSSFVLRVGEDRRRVRFPLLGRYNVENALAASAAASALGLPIDEIAWALERARQVPGRLEVVCERPFGVLIDFAHTPAALEGMLGTVRRLTQGRLIVLFGAGGDRDRAKRAPMAEAVARHADVIVLTSDNPRTEDPEGILDDLETGLADRRRERIPDRALAIRRALELAAPGDTVVLAGKGHETYQLVGTEKRPLDERAIVRDALRAMGIA
ncbi:MAG: UDP-N-acetylmuramoyl-L-alanyl-D-glutamate--2,6-diaminopimelate ligase [Gemmatimonadota bacterium]